MKDSRIHLVQFFKLQTYESLASICSPIKIQKPSNQGLNDETPAPPNLDARGGLYVFKLQNNQN